MVNRFEARLFELDAIA